MPKTHAYAQSIRAKHTRKAYAQNSRPKQLMKRRSLRMFNYNLGSNMGGNSHAYSCREVKLRSFQDRLLSQNQNQNPQSYNEQNLWQLCYLYFHYASFPLNTQLHGYKFLLLEHQGSPCTLYRHSPRTQKLSPSAVAPHSQTCLHVPLLPNQYIWPKTGWGVHPSLWIMLHVYHIIV